jgi:glutaredoxin
VTTLNRGGVNEAPAAQDALPQELRQATTRYPVTLYTAADCPPCESARQLLVQRGVPFTEKLIVSDDDAAAMERVLGARTVPSLTIGSQALRGLSQSDWTAYLVAAGYPRESKLPRNWQAPAATPLAGRSSARPAAAPLATASAPARSAPAEVTPAVPSAPAGFRF